jgi:spore germination protein YaaH
MNTVNNNQVENQKFLDLLEIFEVEANIELTSVQKQKFFRVLELHTSEVMNEVTSNMMDTLSLIRENNKKKVSK